MEQFMLYFVVILICLIFMAATILLGRKKIRRAFMKYIPSLLAAITTLALYIKASMENGFGALGYIIMAVIAAIVFMVSILTAVIIEIINWNNRRSQKEVK